MGIDLLQWCSLTEL